MENYKDFIVIKASGEEEPFLIDKYINSLHKIGLKSDEVKSVLRNTILRLKNKKISTRQLYGITFDEIKKLSLHHASVYSLKESLRSLGPSGFPFEYMISQLFIRQGYEIKNDQQINGKCAIHEIDIIANLHIAPKQTSTTLVEVKFHVEFGHKSDIKIPLYIKARFDDIRDVKKYNIANYTIVTNTKFTINAINYSACARVNLLAWGYPRNNSIEMLIDQYRLYPITVLHCLSDEEKKRLVNNNIILYEDLTKAKENNLISESKLQEMYKEYLVLRS